MPPSFPLTPTSSDGDPFCTQEFCDYEDIYRSRFFRVDSNTSTSTNLIPTNLNGNESVIDTDGFVYAAHSWYPSVFEGDQTSPLGPVITKVSQSTTDLTIIWSRQYKSADGDILGPGGEYQGCIRLVLDANNNLWAVYTTHVADSTGAYSKVKYHFLRISKSTGNILFHKSFILNILPTTTPSIHVWYQSFMAVVDAFGNWYIASSHEPAQTPWAAQQAYFVPVPPNPEYTLNSQTGKVITPWLVKLSSNFTIQWGVRWTGRRYTRNFFFDYTIPISTGLADIKHKGNYIYAVITTSDNFGFAPTLVRINATTGVLDTSWPAKPPLVPDSTPGVNNFPPYTVDYAALITRASAGACIAVDSQSNVYVTAHTGYTVNPDTGVIDNSTLYDNGLIVTKILPNGALQWTKHYFVPSVPSRLPIAPIIHISANDRIFIGQVEGATFNTYRGSDLLYEIASTGQLITARRYENSFENPFRTYKDGIRYLQTYAYSPETLFCRFSLADHVDTTQNVEVFDVPDRTMVQLPLSSITTSNYFVRANTRSFHLDYWATLRSDFYTYSNSFTVTTPDRATRLYDIGQIRD
jgi:hypothetical protein